MSNLIDGEHRSLVAAYLRAQAGLASVAALVAPPALRVALALPFLRSGLTRWGTPFHLAPSTLYLFEDEFRLHLFGQAYAFPAPDAVALLTAVAELTLPTLLLLGLATRWTALGLLLMTGVIELVAPEGGLNFHLLWAAIAIAIMALGAGPLSLDRLISMARDRRRASLAFVRESSSRGEEARHLCGSAVSSNLGGANLSRVGAVGWSSSLPV
jgi:putative oxidoreductase